MQSTETTPNDSSIATPSLRMPDFFIIGAAKCGTTTLYKYLCRHPDVYMSTPKEMSFFSKDEVYDRGFRWYASLFADAKPTQICGEASTTYSRWPTYTNTVERLAAAQPAAKLIYVLRNPAERLYSFYAHRMRASVTASFEEFLERTPEAIDSGRYMTQIRQYLEVFPEEQLLVLFTGDMRDAPQNVLQQVGDFLGLSEFDYLRAGPIRANEGGGKYYASTALTRTINTLKRTPAMKPLLQRMPASLKKSGYEWLANGPVGRRLRRRHQSHMSRLTPELRCQIEDIFREEIEQLEEYTGRDLAAWKGEVAS